MRIVVCAALIVASGIGAAAQEPSGQPEPILQTGELMLLVIKPAYDDLQRAIATPPADRQQWALLYQKAARLAEFENLILFRPEDRSNKPEWKALATDVRKVTMALASTTLKALGSDKSADFDGVKRAYEDVSTRCNACHKTMSREAPRIKP